MGTHWYGASISDRSRDIPEIQFCDFCPLNDMVKGREYKYQDAFILSATLDLPSTGCRTLIGTSVILYQTVLRIGVLAKFHYREL